MYQMEFSPQAREGLLLFRKFDQKQNLDEIETQLLHQPDQETRNRKHLRANKLAEWELRIGTFRVFYDLDKDNAMVLIRAVGYTEGSELFIHGKEHEL